MQISRATATNLKLCILQLLVTEILSICYFAVGRPVLLENIYIGFTAPILLEYGAIYPLEYRGYFFGFFQVFLLNTVLLSILAFSIVKNHKLVGGFSLFLFNLAGILSL